MKILAVNDDKDFCQCCGKQGLRRVVWVEQMNGDIEHLGTSCASNKMTNGKKRVESFLYAEADKMFDEVAEMFWNVSDRKEMESKMKQEFLKRNAPTLFKGLSHNIISYCK